MWRHAGTCRHIRIDLHVYIGEKCDFSVLHALDVLFGIFEIRK